MIGKRPFENQVERVEYGNVIYLINPDENTASVIGSKENVHDVNIPMSINHKSKEYYIISILENAFKNSKIKFVQFASDSKLQTIDKCAFSYSTIKSLRIPSSLTSIGENAFGWCKQLEVIEIPDDSRLQTIDKNAFSKSTIKSIRIPSSVTSIGEGAFSFCELEVIEIPDDSKLQTIDKDSFYNSSIKNIKIPSELTDLKEGWCNDTPYLTEISVSPKNPRYFCYEDKMIIGKSRIEQSNYDCLVFCVRNIREIKIPNFIEHICSYSFDRCKLEMIEISDDSKLQTIDKDAFYNSSIKNIKIPSELTELKEGWCSITDDLNKISVSPKNPRFCFFEDKMIIGKSRIEQSNYDCLVFCVRNIREIKIPNFIEHICSYSFNRCKKLKIVEFSDDSKLQTIDKYAFSFSRIKSIRIPSSVTSIGEGAFCCCEKLEMIEIPDDSKLQTIDENAFLCSTVKSIKIPSELTDLKEGWCIYIRHLTKISVSPENQRYFCYEDKMIIGKSRIEQSNYDCLVFCVRNIREIKIPNFIEHICSCSFNWCTQLKIVEFSDDSKLQTIDKHAFSSSRIKSIRIPSSVTSIGEGAFYCCDNLCIIEIGNSEMISLYQTAFLSCQNALLMIPVHS